MYCVARIYYAMTFFYSIMPVLKFSLGNILELYAASILLSAISMSTADIVWRFHPTHIANLNISGQENATVDLSLQSISIAYSSIYVFMSCNIPPNLFNQGGAPHTACQSEDGPFAMRDIMILSTEGIAVFVEICLE